MTTIVDIVNYTNAQTMFEDALDETTHQETVDELIRGSMELINVFQTVINDNQDVIGMEENVTVALTLREQAATVIAYRELARFNAWIRKQPIEPEVNHVVIPLRKQVLPLNPQEMYDAVARQDAVWESAVSGFGPAWQAYA